MIIGFAGVIKMDLKFIYIGVIALSVTGCYNYRGDEIGLDCENQKYATRLEYWQCVRTREAVRMNELLEASMGDPS